MKRKFLSKKRKALLAVSSLGAMGVTLGAVASVVSCGPDYGPYFRPWGEISLVTDGGSVADKSFNEGAWEGVIRWSKSENNNGGQTIGFTQPAQATGSLLQKAYETAIYNGAKYLVLPGFTHGAFGPGRINAFLNSYPGIRAVAIDTDADYSQASKNQVVHARYYTQESGFLAAIGIALFANSPKSNQGFKLNGEKIKVATFGGQPYNSVTSFMDGLLQGMNTFNKYLNNEIADVPFDQSDFPELGNGEKPKGFELYFNKQAVTQNGIKPHFTESFQSGDAKEIALDYMNNDVQFVFAVAGPQTGDIVTAIKSKGAQGQAFAIGVDTEQSVLYGKPYIVLGSAMKGLAKTTYDILSLDASDKTQRKFDSYIKLQETSQLHATWFGLKDGESFDPAEMFTGFAFNPDLRLTFGPSGFMRKFDSYAKQWTPQNPKGSVFICEDGFGRETFDFKAKSSNNANDKASYEANAKAHIIANCGLTADFSKLLYDDLRG